MSGIEYEVIHVQDPILFVIRKQHRHSPTQGIPYPSPTGEDFLLCFLLIYGLKYFLSKGYFYFSNTNIRLLHISWNSVPSTRPLLCYQLKNG